MKESIAKTMAFDIAVRTISIASQLREDKNYELGSQVLRSSTSIGANIREALETISLKDFAFKMNIAQKECSECLYWHEILIATDVLSGELVSLNVQELTALLKILRSIVSTTRKRISVEGNQSTTP